MEFLILLNKGAILVNWATILMEMIVNPALLDVLIVSGTMLTIVLLVWRDFI